MHPFISHWFGEVEASLSGSARSIHLHIHPWFGEVEASLPGSARSMHFCSAPFARDREAGSLQRRFDTLMGACKMLSGKMNEDFA
jgi:hypothetical protein